LNNTVKNPEPKSEPKEDYLKKILNVNLWNELVEKFKWYSKEDYHFYLKLREYNPTFNSTWKDIDGRLYYYSSLPSKKEFNKYDYLFINEIDTLYQYFVEKNKVFIPNRYEQFIYENA
jgi:hypothetical protein